MRRLDLPLGPLDTSTPDGAVAVSARGVALREASGVVPLGADGYLVPAAASRGKAVAGLLSAAVQARERYSEGDDKTTQPMQRVLAVTEDDVRLVDPTSTADDVVALAFDTSDDTRRPQVAPAGGSDLVVATGLATTPERPVLVRGDGALPWDGDERPWIPDSRVATVSTVAREPGETGGLTFGLYGVRYAAVRADGSLGPASMPTVFFHVSPAAYEWDLATAITAGDATITLTSGGSAAAIVDDLRALAAVYPAGVPARVEGGGVLYLTGGVVSGVNATFDLVEDAPYDVALPAGVSLGERAPLSLEAVGMAYPVPGMTAGDAETLFSGVAVLLSAPLSSPTGGGLDLVSAAEPAAESAYFRAGTFGFKEGTAYLEGTVDVTLTSAELLERAAYVEGAVPDGVRALGVGAFAGRVALTGVALDPVPPSPGASFQVLTAGATRYLASVRLMTDSGPLVRWSEPFTAHADGVTARSGLFWYPSAQATRIDLYRETATTDVYGLGERIALRPTATGGAAYAVRAGALASVAGADLAPDAAGRAVANGELDTNARRVLVSGAGRPFEALAERVLEIGATPSDAVVGLAPLSSALSSGQFGEYPVVALCRASVWGLGLTDTGEVAAVRSVTTARGCVGPEAFVADGGALYYLSADGLYAIGLAGVGRDTNIAAALFTPEEGRPPHTSAYTMAPDASAVLFVFDDGRRRELWAVCPDADGTRRAFVLDLRTAPSTPRWTVLDRPRTGALRLASGTDLLCTTLDAAGLVHEDGRSPVEDAEPDDVERWRLATATVPLAGGLRAVLRRVAASGDLSGRLDMAVTSRTRTSDVDGRPLRLDTPLVTVLLDSAVGHEASAPAHVAHAGVTLAPGATSTPVAGDRVLAVHFALDEPVRARRRRALLT